MLGPWVRTPPSLHSLNGIMLIQVHINKTEASDKWILSGGKKDEMVLVFSSAYRESNLIFWSRDRHEVVSISLDGNSFV